MNASDEIHLNMVFLSEVDKNTTEAKLKELGNWKVERVYDEVLDCGQDVITARWVISPKLVDGAWTTKARLVARGFMEDTTEIRKDSPTCMRESLKLMLAITSAKGWKINSIDIMAAFLQGKRIDREVFLRPPKEADCKGKVWRLNKVIYGLSDASRVWYLRVLDELVKLGTQVSQYDKALFIWKPNFDVQGLIIIHVDDFLWSGSREFKEKVVLKLQSIFKISKMEEEAFKYLGINLTQVDGELLLEQKQYVNSINALPVPAKSAGTHDIGEALKKNYKSLVGQLNWACGTSRPDSSYDSCVLSTVQAKPTREDIIAANKALRELKMNNVTLRYPCLSLKSVRLAVYSDASYGNLKDGNSQGAYVIFLCDETGRCSPIAWSSRKVKRVARSSLAAETLAAVEALDEAYLISVLLQEFLGEKKPREIDLITDNKSLYDAVHTSNLLLDKRLRVDIAALREMVEKNEVNFKWTESSHQLADALTKRGASRKGLLDVLKTGYLGVV